MRKIVLMSFTILLLSSLAIQGVDGNQLYVYLGCYLYDDVINDHNDHVLHNNGLNVSLTVDSCVDKCRELGAAHGGPAGEVCVCLDEDFGDIRAVSAILYCQDTKCPGNPSQYCGGERGISVYSLLEPTTTTTNGPTTTTNGPTTTTNRPTTTTNGPTTTTNGPTTTTNEPMTTTPTRYRPRPPSKYNDTPCEKNSKFYGICQYNDMDCPNGTYTDGLCRRPMNKGQIPFNGAEIHVSCCIYNQHSGYPPMM